MLGCTIFLTPEDIMEVKKKMIFTLVAAIKHVVDFGKKEAMVEMDIEKTIER